MRLQRRLGQAPSLNSSLADIFSYLGSFIIKTSILKLSDDDVLYQALK